MEVDEIDNLATLLKNNEGPISKGAKKVSLTLHVLDKVNTLVNLHIKQMNITNSTCCIVGDTNSVKQNIQTISRLIQIIVHLKLIADIVKVENTVDLSDFKSLNILELHKIQVAKITGLNVLRLHLRQLVCVRSIETLKSLLEDCGGDFSSKYIWAELKILILSYNKLTFLDHSLECTPWLNSLDLSHNELTTADEVTCLSNLKRLNLSFNKLQRLPQFSGQICNRLQIINVSNNFLEEITQLKNLLNVSELDLSNNCLVDHTTLVSLSHMATLQWLLLLGNPLSFHVKHTHNTCIYLHSNIELNRFILDYKQLSSSEIKLIGTFHPLLQKSNSETLSACSGSMKFLTSTEKYKKVRQVDIEDNRSIDKISAPLPNSYSSVDHLEVKYQIQNLREMYGESWLNYYRALNEQHNSTSGSQDISGFGILDETSSNTIVQDNKELLPDNVPQPTELSIYNIVDEQSEVEDIEVNSEDTIYLARPIAEEEELFLVFSQNSLSEINCTTSKERENWVLDTIMNCVFLNEEHTMIQINFDTLRKDRKQRVFILQREDAERFVDFVNIIVNNRQRPSITKVLQCMKCLKQFPKIEDFSASYKEVMQCPSCGSTILIEENVKQGE